MRWAPLARIASRAALPFAAAKIVEDDDFTRCEGGRQHLLDVQREEFAIDRTINDPRRADPVMARRCNEGHCLPMAERGRCDETLATRPRGWSAEVVDTRLHLWGCKSWNWSPHGRIISSDNWPIRASAGKRKSGLPRLVLLCHKFCRCFTR